MKQIEIDEEVYKWLADLAIPFQDDPNAVLRRVLKGKKIKVTAGSVSTSHKRGRVPKTDLYPKAQLGKALLEALNESGGLDDSKKIIEKVENKIGMKLTDNDLDKTKAGQFRWVMRLHAIRNELTKQGYIAVPERGVWELTADGKEYLDDNIGVVLEKEVESVS